MRLGLWSSSPDWKLAREISRNSWAVRSNADVPGQINRQLEKILKSSFPKDEKIWRRDYKRISEAIQQGLKRYSRDFECLESIKHDSEILEAERIKSLNHFESNVRMLKNSKRIDEDAAHTFQHSIDTIRHNVHSSLSADSARERRLKWRL